MDRTAVFPRAGSFHPPRRHFCFLLPTKSKANPLVHRNRSTRLDFKRPLRLFSRPLPMGLHRSLSRCLISFPPLYFERFAGHFQQFESLAVFIGAFLPFPLKALSLSAGNLPFETPRLFPVAFFGPGLPFYPPRPLDGSLGRSSKNFRRPPFPSNSHRHRSQNRFGIWIFLDLSSLSDCKKFPLNLR